MLAKSDISYLSSVFHPLLSWVLLWQGTVVTLGFSCKNKRSKANYRKFALLKISIHMPVLNYAIARIIKQWTLSQIKYCTAAILTT